MLVAQKSLRQAKSRTRLPDDQRRCLAEAMLRDTLAAIEQTDVVDRLIVLLDDPADRGSLAGFEIKTTSGHDLNESVVLGVADAQRRFPRHGVAVLPADLPGLLPWQLSLALRRAERWERAYLPDGHGTGTTLLTAAPSRPIKPAYGPGSAAAHRQSGVVALHTDCADSLRMDVDDLRTLHSVVGTGVGRHTWNWVRQRLDDEPAPSRSEPTAPTASPPPSSRPPFSPVSWSAIR